jgi:hypothetical protein
LVQNHIGDGQSITPSAAQVQTSKCTMQTKELSSATGLGAHGFIAFIDIEGPKPHFQRTDFYDLFINAL